MLMVGHNIFTKTQVIKHLIGLCPQMDVLWNCLTVKEHLYVFANIKNIPRDRVESDISQVLRDIGFERKSNTLTEELTYLFGIFTNFRNYDRRKLALGIAALGNPPILLLDEYFKV